MKSDEYEASAVLLRAEKLFLFGSKPSMSEMSFVRQFIVQGHQCQREFYSMLNNIKKQ